MGGWSQQEDDLLRIAVLKHGVQDNWKAVADDVPGRDNKACRKVRCSAASDPAYLIELCRDGFILSLQQ